MNETESTSGNESDKRDTSEPPEPGGEAAGGGGGKTSRAGLRNELIKIVVEKGLLALLLVAAGIYSTNLVEKLKSERSFSAQLNKTGVEKISEVWESLYLFEAAYDELTTFIKASYVGSGKDSRSLVESTFRRYLEKALESKESNTNKEKGYEARGLELFKLQEERNKKALGAANKNRFWLGEDSYLAIKNHIELLEENRYAVLDEANAAFLANVKGTFLMDPSTPAESEREMREAAEAAKRRQEKRQQIEQQLQKSRLSINQVRDN